MRFARPGVAVAALFAVLTFAAVAPVPAADTATQLDQILAGAHREPKNAARDKYRHPKEALLFFGIQPNMTVVEVWPATGWWTEVLAPLLRDNGKYYAAYYPTESPGAPDYVKGMEKGFDAKLAARPELYGEVIRTKVLAPDFVELAPKGSADMVLTFRNVHNWAKAGNAEAMFRAFYEALKPGGILGVTDHRAKPGTPFDEQIRTGYLTEEYVISVAEKAGFRLAGSSEINANPRDTKDWPGGVWTLPPTLRFGDKDREKYLAVGESDRMTLRFVKP